MVLNYINLGYLILLLEKNKLVFIYQKKNKIYTYQTIELDKKNKLFLLGLLRNSQEKKFNWNLYSI